jgi:hypothetical protein
MRKESNGSSALGGYSFSRRDENLIAALREIPVSTSRSRIRPTREIGSVLDKVLSKFKITQRIRPEDVLMENWSDIIGAQYARLAAPQTITQDHVLVIQVNSPALREQLRFDERRILKAIKALSECKEIKRIVWR